MDNNRLRSALKQDFETGLSFVNLEGPLDVASAPAARAALLKSAAEHPQAIIVDINRVSVSHRTILLVFAAAARHLSDQRIGLLIVVDPTSPIGNSAHQALTGRVGICDTHQEAIAATQAAAPTHRMHSYLPASSTSPAVARALVRYACESWGLADILDAATIVVSELVSNAVTHARTNLDVTIVRRTEFVVIQVRDHSSDPLMRWGADQPPIWSTQGRGLPLVDHLTSGWGTSHGPSGKAVWATLRIPQNG